MMASRTACPAGRDVFEYMSEQGWSDGLPLVPPTPARVKHMLTGTARNPDEILGHRVALLDISKPNGNLLLDTIEKQLAKYDVTCTRYSKPAFAKPLPREMAERITATSDAAIIALAD